MPKTLEKTRKKIAKKRHGAIGALHEGSRDSRRLHKAQVRDERLVKLAAARRKQERPLVDRVSQFRTLAREGRTSPLSIEAVRQLIEAFVHQHDDELDELKKARRPGRPSSTKEDLLNLKISSLQKEYQTGFLIPDLTSEENLSLLDRWEGSWSYLTLLQWVRISRDGPAKPSSFPPSGDS